MIRIWYDDGEIGISSMVVPRNTEKGARDYFNTYYRYQLPTIEVVGL